MRSALFGFAIVAAVAAGVAVAVVPQAGTAGGVDCAPRWRVIAHTEGAALNALAALSPTDVWAAGWSGPASKRIPVLVNWDGRRLHRYTAFHPTRKGGGELWALSAVSAKDIWALGSDGLGADGRPVIVHWDGLHWRLVPLPLLPRDAGISDIAAAGANDVWVVGWRWRRGRPLVMHWKGENWRVLDMSTVAPHGSRLEAVDAASPDNVWAVGVKGLDGPSSYGYSDFVLRWNGRRWARIASPLAGEGGGQYALAVDVAPSGEVWTANQDDSGNQPAFVRFGADSDDATVYWPDVDLDPYEITAASAESVWISGNHYNLETDRDSSGLVHWNGVVWRFTHIPRDGLKSEPYWSLSALSPTDIWAAGSQLLARYSC
jgi:hypothetical protein